MTLAILSEPAPLTVNSDGIVRVGGTRVTLDTVVAVFKQVLLDECAPRPLKRELADYEIRTVVEMGWSGKKNGELLRLMNQEGSRFYSQQIRICGISKT